MSQLSQISRYRPAVIAMTGAAAACGIYLIYDALSGQSTGSALHRSNAIHRPRGARSTAIIEFSENDVNNAADPDSDDSIVIGGARGNENPRIPETDGAEGEEAPDPDQGLHGLLFHIAETDQRRKAYEHRGIHCEECGERPIRGIRWHCLNCPDFDLCPTCEASTEHTKTHVFAKIKIPLPVLSQPTKEYPIWYPGDPRKVHRPLDATLKKRLTEEFEYDSDEYVNAHYDQFICIANVPWPSDPNCVHAAIDQRAFNKALTSERWPQRFRPNAIYDRMFAFYDRNNDGLIGFEEFVGGIAYLRSHNRFKPLRRALQGFDVDEDGFVDRKDFLRLMRAKLELHKLLINAMVEGHENEQTQAAMDKIRSSQPISSIFNYEELPAGVHREPDGKQRDPYGDMQPLPGTKTILEDDEMWPDIHPDRPGAPYRAVEPDHPYGILQHHVPGLDEERNSIDAVGTANKTEKVDGSMTVHQPGDALSDANGSITSTSNEQYYPSNVNGHEDGVLDQDYFWQIAEDSFHAMLDPLFKYKEQKDLEAIETRRERGRWRTEIDQTMKDKEVFEEELVSASKTDPLMATAMNSYRKDSMRQDHQLLYSLRTDMVDRMVPTNRASLERREVQIAEAPLDELLDGAGYSVNEIISEDDNNESRIEDDSTLDNTRSSTEWSSTDTPPLQNQDRIVRDHPSKISLIISSDLSFDPTMPQNRSNAASLDQTFPLSAKGPPPGKSRLEYLVFLDKQDRELESRGGPGRLSFYEVEEAVKADPTKELKGLVTSWLEWASF